MAPTTVSPSTQLRGVEWLLQPSDPAGIFTPERMTDEHRLIYKVVQDEIRIAQCRYHYED